MLGLLDSSAAFSERVSTQHWAQASRQSHVSQLSYQALGMKTFFGGRPTGLAPDAGGGSIAGVCPAPWVVAPPAC